LRYRDKDNKVLRYRDKDNKVLRNRDKDNKVCNRYLFLTTIIFYSNACYNQLHKPKLLIKQYIYII
jgi:hypothetical protein